MKKGFLNIKNINKFLVSQVVMCLLLLAFCMPKVNAETALCISELEKTGDYKKNNAESTGMTITKSGITVTTSKEDNAELSKNEAIKITAQSNNGIKRIEAILYDSINTKVVNTAYYVDSEGLNKNTVLSINTPNCPCERLLLKIHVIDLKNDVTFEKTYLMKKSILTIYAQNLSDDMISGSDLEFYTDASNSSVPIKYLEYTLKDGSKILKSGKSYLEDSSYFVTEEGNISYKSRYQASGEGTFTNEYANSRLKVKIQLPSANSNVTLEIKAEDILGNVATKTKSFNIKNVNVSFNIDTNGVSKLKVGNSITVNAKTNDNFGLSKLEVTVTDNKDDSFVSKDIVSSHVTNGDGTLKCNVPIPNKEKINVYALCTDIAGNTKEYGPVSYEISYNEHDVTPIFILSNEPKMMGQSEIVSVTSNSGILFTQLCVKITDEKGEVIKDENGTSKISAVSSSVGKANLEVEIEYPETNKDKVYFVFSAKDIYGKIYDGGGVFETLSDVYKKGPIEIYSNRITISASPQTGIINRNSEIKLKAKVDINESPISNISYVYYNNEKRELPSGLVMNSKMPCVYKFTDGNQSINGEVKVSKVSSDIIEISAIENSSMKKDGYVLYASRPKYENGIFVMNSYYAKEEAKNILVCDSSLYSISKGLEILGYGAMKESGIIASETIKGPERNATDIVLEVTAKDTKGKSKTSVFNYYQNKSSVKIESLPGSGTIYSGGYIKAIATAEAGRSIASMSYEVYDDSNNLILNGTETRKNENGQIEIDYKMPTVDSDKNIKVRYKAIDSDNNIYSESYSYLLKSYLDITKINDSDLKMITARYTGGVNEYIIEYKDETGSMITAQLNKQEATGINYLYTNVKDMELLNISKINEILVSKKYNKISKIEDIKKMYIKLNIYYALTCRIGTKDEYVDITKNMIVTKNDSNYLGIKNAYLDLGYGGKVSDIFDIDMRNEILHKAQKQEVKEIDFNSLGTNDVIKNVYYPEKLNQAEIKSKAYSPKVTLNDEYIASKTKLNSEDFKEGFAFTASHKEITNNVHILVNKYKLENYSVNIIDNSIHKNHTYKIDEFGEIIELCSSECILYPETKTVTCYYSGVKENKTVTQNVTPTYEVKYLTKDGTMAIIGSGMEAKYDELGRVFIKVYANYNPKTLYEIVSETEFGEFGIEIDSAYPDDGELKNYIAESNGKWLYFDGIGDNITDTIKITINPKNYINSLYFNKEKNRYERSSDRGSVLSFNVTDASSSQIKDVKVQYKTTGGYGITKTLAAYSKEANVKTKGVDVNIPSEVLENGGNVEIKIWATNYDGDETDGKVYISGKTAKETLNVFINTTPNTNVVPDIKGKNESLINNNGTINTDVLLEIGEGKTSNKETALKLTKVYDTKWTQTTNKYDASNMAIYYNSLNDTIGLGYKVSFSLDSIGYGTDYFIKDNKLYSDILLCQMKFFMKVNNKYEEVVPFVEEQGQYVMCAYSNKYRQLKMQANPSINNDDAIGLNSLVKNGDKVTWNFSYFLPSNTKFKSKNDLEGNYVTEGEILVQMDAELYKYYSVSDDSSLVKNGQYNDSRHLYTLRENRWTNKALNKEENIGGVTIKNIKVKLRDIVDTTKGLVFWYDSIKNATFDITGSKSY